MKADPNFIKYIKEERLNISKALLENWLTLTPKERVAIENLLIAYDQMAEKLSEPIIKPDTLTPYKALVKQHYSAPVSPSDEEILSESKKLYNGIGIDQYNLEKDFQNAWFDDAKWMRSLFTEERKTKVNTNN